MISKRIQLLTNMELRGELLAVINAWSDEVEVGIDEQERLRLVDILEAYLT